MVTTVGPSVSVIRVRSWRMTKFPPYLHSGPYNSYKTKSGASNASYFPSAHRTTIFNGRWFLFTSSVPENITVQLMGDAVKENWRYPDT